MGFAKVSMPQPRRTSKVYGQKFDFNRQYPLYYTDGYIVTVTFLRVLFCLWNKMKSVTVMQTGPKSLTPYGWFGPLEHKSYGDVADYLEHHPDAQLHGNISFCAHGVKLHSESHVRTGSVMGLLLLLAKTTEMITLQPLNDWHRSAESSLVARAITQQEQATVGQPVDASEYFSYPKLDPPIYPNLEALRQFVA
jgi:hypothetical protein